MIMDRILKNNGWVKCSEYLPNKNGEYIVCYNSYGICYQIVKFCEGYWNAHKDCNGNICTEHAFVDVYAWHEIEPFEE